jgi:hypothetical protein
VARPGGCPGCEHDDGAAGRALDTVLDGLADDLIRDRCPELGGLCIPHLRAASVRGDHRTLAWLAQTMTAAASVPPPSPDCLAGTDHDADTRVVLRGALPTGTLPGSGMCAACLAAGQSEASHLARIARSSDRGQPDHRLLLCAGPPRAVRPGQAGPSAPAGPPVASARCRARWTEPPGLVVPATTAVIIDRVAAEAPEHARRLTVGSRAGRGE